MRVNHMMAKIYLS